MPVFVAPHGVGNGKSVRPVSISEPEESSFTSSASNSEFARSAISRRDTEQILDYYQSEDAGRSYISSSSESFPSQRQSARAPAPTSARSTMRPSSAGRDSNMNPPRTSMESVASSSGGVQRRTSQRSAGGADKRRLAIVQLDTERPESQVSTVREQRPDTSASFTQPPPDPTLLSRRGVDSARLRGLALVAPPDAQPMDYSGLTPIPASAPATAVPPMYRATKTEASRSGHQRSLSEAQSPRKGATRTSPRDVGIVGTLGSMCSSPQEKTSQSYSKQRPSTADGDGGSCEARSDALTSPVFQTPRSRSPSPLLLTNVPSSPDAPTSDHTLAHGWTSGGGQQLTPDIGQEKDIRRPVAGPVVLDLGSGQPISGRSPHSMTSMLPPTDLHSSASYSHMDRNTQRTSSRLPFKPNQPGLYLHYQPGVHSTAGPLPSPPRNIVTKQNTLPPPRPPRVLSPPPTRRSEMEHTTNSPRESHPDRSRSMQVTSLKPPASLADSDFSISAVSASSSGSDDRLPGLTSSAPDENDTVPRMLGRHDQTDKNAPRNGTHVREGAFPASSVFLSHPSQLPLSHDQHRNLDNVVASIGGASEHEETSNSTSALASETAAPPALRHSHARPNLKRENSWVSLSAESLGGGPDNPSPPSSYPSSDDESTRVTTTNLGSDDGLVTQKRALLPAPPIIEPHPRVDSLPRTPSLLSVGQHSRTEASSPSSRPAAPKKPPSSWPDAMNFHEVLTMKLAADRALTYAAKIRELATEETGLRDWLLLSVRKERREAPPAIVSSATTATSRAFNKQPRHLSRTSMASEVTFPIRNDSYTATDLSPRPTIDLSPSISPSAPLPYPSLAHGVGVRRRSSRTFTVESPVASLSGPSRSLGTGFFASIGRKASIKKDRPFPATSPNKLISSRQPPQPPQPRPVKLGAPPTLPGGPRAPARSAQRANSVVFSSPEPPRTEAQVLSMPVRQSSESMEAFDRQVEKLSDLLPQADKGILAGYLRRAQNQDPMLAIGTYLEDEKQGCLRRD